MAEREVYYFGCWGEAGHFLWTPNGQRAGRKPTPWSLSEIDGELSRIPHPPGYRPRGSWDKTPQTEGVVQLHHRDGWTAIAFWDRSCDSRPGSNSAFIARGDLTGEELLELFEASFPAVWSRITARFTLVLPEGSTTPSVTPAASG